MSEPNSKFPKVSSCHRAPLGIHHGDSGWYFCKAENCGEPCDAVSDEGLDGKGLEEKCKYSFCPAECEGHKKYSNEELNIGDRYYPKKENSEIPKIANSSGKPNCFACQDEKDNNSTVENYYHYCAKKDNLPSPDAKEEKLTAKDLEDAIKMLESMPDQNESLAAIAKLNGIPVIESSLVTRPTLVVPNKQSFLEQFNPTTP